MLVLFLAACGTPVPPAKMSYVGEWAGKDMRLAITADGRVEYERKKGNGSSKISAPIKEWKGDDFLVGLGPVVTTFKVSKPPHDDGGKWKMVVDGVELTRIGGAGGMEWTRHTEPGVIGTSGRIGRSGQVWR